MAFFSLFLCFFPLLVVVPPFPWGASEYNNIIAVVVERNHYKNGTGGGTWTWTWTGGGIANGYFVGDLKNAQMERGGGQGKWEARGIVMETDNGCNDRGKEGGGGDGGKAHVVK